MAWLHGIRRVLSSVVHRTRLERELEDELSFHLDARADDLMRQGLSAREARRRARLEMGRVELYKDDVRRAVGVRLLDEARQDLRYAGRALGHNPGFASTAMLTLALGIGANTGIYSLLDAVVLESLPVPRPHELFALHAVGQAGGSGRFSHETFRALDAAIPEGRIAAMTRSAACRSPSAGSSPSGRVFSSSRPGTSRVYGVLSYVVTRRTPELGIRRALGASTPHIVGLVVKESIPSVGLGAVAGMLAAGAAVRSLHASLSPILFEIPPGDWLSLAGATLVLSLAAAAAAFFPARRAARIDPPRALRYE